MKNLIYFIFGVVLIISGCTKTVSPGGVSVNIIGIVTNSDNGLPVKGVEVRWGTGKNFSNTLTDKNGMYAITGVPAGQNYTIVFSKTGFATLMNTCVAKVSLTEIGSENYTEVIDNNVTVDSLSGTITLTLFKQLSNGTSSIAAANFSYSIYLNNPYDAPITGTSDANGYITVTGLPKYSPFTLVISQVDDGYTYNYRTAINLNSNPINNLTISPIVSLVYLGLVSSNLLDKDGKILGAFTAPQAIVFNFTSALDTASASYSVSISPSFASGLIVSFQNNNQTLTIDPNTMTDFKKSKTYTLFISVTAISNPAYTYIKTFTFTTK